MWHLNSARPWLGCEECWLASYKISISVRCFNYLLYEISRGCEIQLLRYISNMVFTKQVGRTISWNFGMLKRGESFARCECKLKCWCLLFHLSVCVNRFIFISCSHGHKNTVLCVKWNQNGNWVLTASKDQIIKVGNLYRHGTKWWIPSRPLCLSSKIWMLILPFRDLNLILSTN